MASVLGFDVKTAYAQAQELKIARTTETRSTCPYCAVELRRHHSHDRRQGQERDSSSGPRGRRSGSSDQSRNALPQGLLADAGHLERAAAAEAAGAPARVPIIGKTSRGTRPTTRLRATSRRPATIRSSHGRAGPHREPAAKASPGSAAAPTPTNSISWLSRPCAAWESPTSKIRPGFDTAPRSPVWGQHSEEGP